MKRLINFIYIICFAQTLFAQSSDTLFLDDCYNKAVKNYPLYEQKDLYKSASKLRLKNYSTNYLPTLDFNAQATYQSDVPGIEMPMMNISKVSKDQYRASIDLKQVIYDGGLTSSLKKIEKADFDVLENQLDVELYKLKEKVNNIYFYVLLLQENEKLLNTKINEIKERQKNVESSVKNGVLLESNIDVLEAALLKTNQQLIDVRAGEKAAFLMLQDYIKQPIDEKSILVLPKIEIDFNDSINRPENKLFDNQINKIDLTSKLISKKRNPKLIGFGQLGYGRPGLNMLSDDFDTYYIFGAKVSWNIWDWKNTGRQKDELSIQKNIINTQKQTFDNNINIVLDKEKCEIEKFEDLIETDKEIIKLRTKILKRSASKLENGVITSSDYLVDLNAETQSKINLKTHKIRLVQSKINYLTIKGN
ncbi:MAG: TolC family protein [Bacteroidetes bacterium]|nr:MAG: TolC family protein [Bacteroidota bacterium]